jgi:hypothetical protein
MTIGSIFACSIIVFIGMAGHSVAHATDIDGVWASDARSCNRIYVKANNRISFAKDSDLHGSGFIIEKDRIRGKMANCSIKLRKEKATRVELIATCSTDIAVETVQFSLRIEGPNKVIREFPGIPEMAIPYERCAF